MSESAAEESGSDTLNDDDCGRCQLGGAGIPPSPAATRHSPPPDKLSSFDNGAIPESGKPDRPERPKWERAA